MHTRVRVYDSTNCKPNLSVQVQASSILKTDQSHVVFQLEKMQLQKGGVDCGLFAIAIATEYCYGNNPASYRYDQTLLRPHFLKCCEERRMTPFPSKWIPLQKPISRVKVKLHCKCRLPEDGEEEMAYCPSCKVWYHKSCENIPDVVFTDTYTSWTCCHCS